MDRAAVILANWLKHSDLLVAVGVLLIIAMMIIPLPTALLSFFLVLNLTFSLLILMITMYSKEPLQFSIFPSMLLLTTLFRLSLNISSSRLILLEGDAGSVIEGFGNFVVGGNAVVGFIVFVILVIIQFIVITRGAERVAEVAARFTLDAMPGKQMSIDADLNAGVINDAEARARRRAIQREADFYGAMDGASKFVKGDAIAGIIIVVVNLIGGFVIGAIEKGTDDLLGILHQYSLLTVGDGLVTQIPALLISTATGIVVTRAASDSDMGTDIVGQLSSQPKAMYIVSVVLALLAVIPGLPAFPFLTVALLTGGLGYLIDLGVRTRDESLREEASAGVAAAPAGEPLKPESVVSLLPIDPMEIELGYALLPLADPNQGGDLMERVVAIRRQCALDLGLVLPYIRVRDNIQLRPTNYVVKLKGVEITQGEIYPDHYLAMDPGSVAEEVPGTATTEPAFGLPALWVSAANKERAEMAGYTVVDPPTVVATHLTEIVRSHAHELLGRQEVQVLLNTVKESHPAVVEELVPNLLTLGEMQKILQNLLREGVSIRDLVSILESVADQARNTRDTDLLTEAARQRLGRAIIRQLGIGHDSTLAVITLHPDLETKLTGAIDRREGSVYFALQPDTVQEMLNSLVEQVNRATSLGHSPVVLASPNIRIWLKRLSERVAPRLTVLSYNEVDPSLKVEAVGMVNLP